MADDVPPEVTAWLADLGDRLGVDPPDEATVTALLALASTAAHASQRMAAPLACWMAGRVGLDAAAIAGLAADAG